MTRHELREKMIFATYQYLLLKKDLKECLNDSLDQETDNDFVSALLNDLNNNLTDYIYEIGALLNKWTFDRLNFVDQAILLVALSEIKLGLNDKAVIIDEAVKFTKKYSDEDSYKYVNGVLDRL